MPPRAALDLPCLARSLPRDHAGGRGAPVDARITEELMCAAECGDGRGSGVKGRNRMSSPCDELDPADPRADPSLSKFEGDCEIETPYPRDGHIFSHLRGRQESGRSSRSRARGAVHRGDGGQAVVHAHPHVPDDLRPARGPRGEEGGRRLERDGHGDVAHAPQRVDAAEECVQPRHRLCAPTCASRRVTSAKQETSEHDEKASDLRASHQVKLALTDSTVVGQDPPRPKEKVTLAAVWPYGRSREGKDL